MNLGMVAYAFNPNFQEAKAGGSQVWGQPWLHSDILSQKKKNLASIF
jgi:hypothetical protein